MQNRKERSAHTASPSERGRPARKVARVISAPRPGEDGSSKGMLLGYARVSTIDQNLALQRDALRRSGTREDFHRAIVGRGDGSTEASSETPKSVSFGLFNQNGDELGPKAMALTPQSCGWTIPWTRDQDRHWVVPPTVSPQKGDAALLVEGDIGDAAESERQTMYGKLCRNNYRDFARRVDDNIQAIAGVD